MAQAGRVESDSKVLASPTVATLHIRNVPDDVVEVLKRRAKLFGRSLNAEVVEVLRQSVPRPYRTVEEVLESIRKRAERIKLPPDAPDIVDVIREGREERDARIRRAIEGRD